MKTVDYITNVVRTCLQIGVYVAMFYIIYDCIDLKWVYIYTMVKYVFKVNWFGSFRQTKASM